MSLALLHSFFSTTFRWIWSTSVATAILVGVVLLIELAFQKLLPPRWRYTLWLLVALRMLMPAVPESRFSLLNLSGGLVNSPFWASSALPETRGRSEEPTAPPHFQPEEARSSFALPPPTTNAVLLPRHSLRAQFFAALPWLWLLGTGIYLLSVLVQHHRLSSRLKSQKPSASESVALLVENARSALRLRREVSVVETNLLSGPALFGFLRPRLLLPREVVGALNTQELSLVILHELVHVQRRDVLMNWLLVWLQALHWFNPLVWLAMRRLRAERELVCDAAVLRHLRPEERRAYGSTLIKMVDFFSRSSLAPSLVPILNRKSEIHRRITMIAQFKPTPRLATFASAMLALALGCITFTTAAEKPPPQAPTEAPTANLDREKAAETHERGIKILEDQMAQQSRLIQLKQAELEDLRGKLGIIDSEAPGSAGGAPAMEMLRKLDGLRVESKANFVQTDTLYNYLRDLPRSDLKSAMLTVTPDAALVDLLNHQALAERELTKYLDSFGAEHPEVKRTRAVLEKVNQQIDERLKGILIGFKAKREAEKARLENLEMEMEKTRKAELEMAARRQPYEQRRRELESLQFMREKLTMRIWQEKIDAAMPK